MPGGNAPAHRLFGPTRLTLWALLLACVALMFAVLLRPPGLSPLHSAEQLHASHLRLELALVSAAPAPADLPPELVRAVQVLDHHLAAVGVELAQANFNAPELVTLEKQWTLLRARLSREGNTAAVLQSLRSQVGTAAALSQAVRELSDEQLARAHLWQVLLMGVLALALLAGVANLWRERRRLGQSLHQFSDDLGNGAWQSAVKGLRDEDSAPSAFGALANGVESVLGQSERRWQALADLSADWYWETDAEHRISWLSRSAPFLTEQGWQVEDVLGHRHDQIAFFRPPPGGWRNFHDALAKQIPFRDLEFQVAAQRGPGLVWVSLSGRARLDEQGSLLGYEGVGRDVSERKLAHEILLANEQRWSTMVGLASDWYWETDREHRLLPLRPELRQRFGNLLEQVEGQTRWDAYGNALTPEQWAEHRADLEAHRPFRSLQIELEVRPGRFVWFSVSGVPRFDSQHRFRGYHGVGRDITARKEAERLLMRHNETLQRAVAERTHELQQLNADLDAFARQLAHELRTPIGHVQGLATLLQSRLQGQLRAEDEELLSLQIQAASQMNELVEALMALARSTLLPMPREVVNLSALAQEVVAELPDLVRSAPLQWAVQDGIWVEGSAAALKIVLANLLGNAAKFTRDSLAPLVSVEAEGQPEGRMCVRVVDNGVGFPPDQAQTLFHPFRRLRSAHDYSGTGIGLTIVQRIIERHGGSVSAQGVDGGGACFEFVLKAAAAADAAAATPAATVVDVELTP